MPEPEPKSRIRCVSCGHPLTEGTWEGDQPYFGEALTLATAGDLLRSRVNPATFGDGNCTGSANGLRTTSLDHGALYVGTERDRAALAITDRVLDNVGGEATSCGRVLVGRGGDTYDPLCVLAAGHEGPCAPEGAGLAKPLRRGDPAICPNGHAMDEGMFYCPACGAYRPSASAS